MSERFKIRERLNHGVEPLPMLELADLGYSYQRLLLPYSCVEFIMIP
jgi:hypothetical protein